MTRRLLAGYLTITVFVLLVLVVSLGITFADRERSELLADLERDARVVAIEVEEPLEDGQPVEPSPRVLGYVEEANARVVVVDLDGIELYDTDAPATAPARDFSTRPEFQDALAGGQAIGDRYSSTLDERLFYAAVPVASTAGVFGAVRITLPGSEFDERVADNWQRLGLLSAVVIVSVVVIGWVTARTVTGPVRELQVGAIGLSSGDLTLRVPAGRGPPELREAAAAFNVMASRLEQLVDSQRWFVSAASHELRTPLTALRLRLESLEDDVSGDGRRRLRAAIAETDRFVNLVDGLLALARADAEASPPEVLDVSTVIADRVELWGPLAEEHDIELTASSVEEGLIAVAVPTAVGQIVDNLISNAVDAIEDGGHIRIEGRRRGEWVLLTVADDGPGVEEARWEEVFERFRRGPDAAPGGSGLGLALVRQLAHASGGDARAVAHPLGGFAVEVALPTFRRP